MLWLKGVLTNGIDDFEDSDELYDAVGGVLHEVADGRSEEEIRYVINK